MKKIRALIVDDEPLARDGLAMLLQDEADIEIVGMCADGRTALAEIKAGQPDLVFLDVQMPEYSGLEVYAELPSVGRPAVVFVTAYGHYAVQAFELCAVDYVLKPFRDLRFKAALARAREQIHRAELGEVQRHTGELLARLRGMIGAKAGTAAVRRLVFKSGPEHFFLAVRDIAWIEAQGRTIRIGAAGQVHLAGESLQNVERRLDAADFVRIHRSFIVQIRCVHKIVPAAYGDYTVVMNDGVKVRLSRTFRDQLGRLLSGSGE